MESEIYDLLKKDTFFPFLFLLIVMVISSQTMKVLFMLCFSGRKHVFEIHQCTMQKVPAAILQTNEYHSYPPTCTSSVIQSKLQK